MAVAAEILVPLVVGAQFFIAFEREVLHSELHDVGVGVSYQESKTLPFGCQRSVDPCCVSATILSFQYGGLRSNSKFFSPVLN